MAKRLSITINKKLYKQLNEKQKDIERISGIKPSLASVIRNIIEEYLTQKDEPVDVTQNVAEEILPEKTITENANIAEKPNIPTKSEIIEEERKINLDFYNRHKNEINEKYKGKYVVIAEGEIKSIGNSLKDVEKASLNSNHRFVFEVKPKKEVRGTLIWPMERV